jgi:hypothetical protein
MRYLAQAAVALTLNTRSVARKARPQRKQGRNEFLASVSYSGNALNFPFQAAFGDTDTCSASQVETDYKKDVRRN